MFEWVVTEGGWNDGNRTRFFSRLAVMSLMSLIPQGQDYIRLGVAGQRLASTDTSFEVITTVADRLGSGPRSQRTLKGSVIHHIRDVAQDRASRSR